jgi:hypothetical protein
VTWRDVAIQYPEFVQWVAAKFGPLPDGPVTGRDYARYADAYDAACSPDEVDQVQVMCPTCGGGGVITCDTPFGQQSSGCPVCSADEVDAP